MREECWDGRIRCHWGGWDIKICDGIGNVRRGYVARIHPH